MSVAFLIGAFGLRRNYKRNEADVLHLAAENLEVDGEAETLDSNV